MELPFAVDEKPSACLAEFDTFIKNCNFVATSAPCKRMFSKTRNIVADRRAGLTSKKVKKLIFLNVNLRRDRLEHFV